MADVGEKKTKGKRWTPVPGVGGGGNYRSPGNATRGRDSLLFPIKKEQIGRDDQGKKKESPLTRFHSGKKDEVQARKKKALCVH